LVELQGEASFEEQSAHLFNRMIRTPDVGSAFGPTVRRCWSKTTLLGAVLCSLHFSGCARFQPTQPAMSASDFTPTAMQQSFTMSDSSVRYDPNVLHVGAARSAVMASYGDPNGTSRTDRGLTEDIYAFNPDGSKFVNPQVRPRNLALGFATRGASMAVRQARLASKERKLTLFHVTYSGDHKIRTIKVERLPGAPDQLPSSQ
jgi:hypothetical protein